MKTLTCVSLEVGRGHPNYLDSFLKVYPKEVFLIKKDWWLIKRLYLLGGKGGLLTKIYNQIRRQKMPKVLLFYLANALRDEIKEREILVSHPILAQALKDRYRVFYIHGEIAAPEESIVDAFRVFVPLPETRNRFLSFLPEEKVIVTGLMIEPELVEKAERAFQERIKRLMRRERLTFAFFSSGAYPKAHIKKIVRAAKSAVRAGIKIYLFVGNNLSLKRYLTKILPEGEVIFSQDRREENEIVGELLNSLDGFVAPAHERTNWCCGLGLPLFCLLPHIGSYAPLNYQFARSLGVCLPLKEEFGEQVLSLSDEGNLLAMAGKGFGKFPIDGAKKTAEKVFELLGDS